MLSVLIADDEKPARDELRWLLEKDPDIRIAGEAENGLQVLEFLKKDKADLLLLDIQMPGMTGLETARQLTELPVFPQLVFITAYDQYAIEAFDVNALDYLLKPIEEERLQRAVRRAKNRLSDPSAEKTLEKSLLSLLKGAFIPASKAGKSRKLTVYREGRFVPISFEDILLMRAEDKQSVIVTAEGEFPYRKSLGELENLVDEPSLFKCHRSFTVNLNAIEAVEPWFNSAFKIRLKGVEELVPVSRSKTAELKALLNMD